MIVVIGYIGIVLSAIYFYLELEQVKVKARANKNRLDTVSNRQSYLADEVTVLGSKNKILVKELDKVKETLNKRRIK